MIWPCILKNEIYSGYITCGEARFLILLSFFTLLNLLRIDWLPCQHK